MYFYSSENIIKKRCIKPIGLIVVVIINIIQFLFEWVINVNTS